MIKKFIFYTVTLFLVLTVVELSAYLAYRLLFGDITLEQLVEAPDPGTDNPTTRPDQAAVTPGLLLHPYIGYVTQTGYKLYPSLAQPKPQGEVWILIVGGSVANSLKRWGHFKQVLDRYLTERGSDARVRVFSGASGGYKQPQQLLQVNYLLALGVAIDLVINIDGFNDIVLPHFDNARIGVDPFFPRSWAKHIAVRSGQLDPLAVGRIAYLRDRQRSIIDFVSTNPLGKLALVELLATTWYSDAQRRIVELDRELHRNTDELSLEQRGPERPRQDRDQVLRESARVWARSSLLLADLLKQRNIEYFHFLQPNQYVKNSKPLSAEEQAHFYRPQSNYGINARTGYPLLQRSAEKLLRGRIHYFDATGLFVDEADTVYMDTCCHFNQVGNLALVDFVIGKTIEHSARFPSHRSADAVTVSAGDDPVPARP